MTASIIMKHDICNHDLWFDGIAHHDDHSGMATYGDRIRSKRKEAGLSQSELADRCGWGLVNNRISQYENCKTEPGHDDFRTIANALGNTTPAWLHYGSDGGGMDIRNSKLQRALQRLASADVSPAKQELIAGLIEAVEAQTSLELSQKGKEKHPPGSH